MAEILQVYPVKGKKDMMAIVKKIQLVFDQDKNSFMVRNRYMKG